MSLVFSVEAVERVLLGDRWHRVYDRSFEAARRSELLLGDDVLLVHDGPCFTFVERRGFRRVRVSGPLSAVLAFEERFAPLDVAEEDEAEDALEDDELEDLEPEVEPEP